MTYKVAAKAEEEEMEINVNRLQHWTKITPSQKKRECRCVCVCSLLLAMRREFLWLDNTSIYLPSTLNLFELIAQVGVQKKKKAQTHVPTHCVPKKKKKSPSGKTG